MRGWGGGGGVGVVGSQPMSTAVYRSPNKLWRSNSIFNLCLWGSIKGSVLKPANLFQWALLLLLFAPFQRALFLVISFRLHELFSANHSLQSLHLIVSLSVSSLSPPLLFYELPMPLLWARLPFIELLFSFSMSSPCLPFSFHELSFSLILLFMSSPLPIRFNEPPSSSQ